MKLPQVHIVIKRSGAFLVGGWSIVIGIMATPTSRAAEPPRLDWAGRGEMRIVVRVDPTPADSRASSAKRIDERPAEIVLNFDKLLAEQGARRVDLNTVQVIGHEATSGKPVPPSPFAFGSSQWDVPWRWYDATIDYEFPEVEANASSTDGPLSYVTRTRFGYFYDSIGDWRQGHLAFVHRAERDHAAWYAIYFDQLPAGSEPAKALPRGFLGDGLDRCAPVGDSTTGLIHSRVDVIDFNADGQLDLLVGCARGGMVWYRGIAGEHGAPTFPYSKFVRTSEGRPLDIGWSAAPKAVDWDGDGLFDLLVGAEWNRIVLYRNRGPRDESRFECAGPLRTADGAVLILPTTPVPEGQNVFKVDYYPVVETVDWDADGDLDLLAGGYITGRIYWFENGAGVGMEPKLTLRGPLEADGAVIDVGWAAAPTVADLDDDGDLDLVTGSMPMTAEGGDSASSEGFLYYFRNDGTRREPRLHATALPRDGALPRASLATPRLVDYSGDGILDLVVSSGTQIYLYQNSGTRREPRFAVDNMAPLASRWGSAALGAVQFLDFDGDGFVDGANGTQVYRNEGKGSPGLFASPVSLLQPGQNINHLSGIGDDWQFQRLFDLDADGRIDLMDADHAGRIWWHRNLGTKQQAVFDLTGVRLSLLDGTPVEVGLQREGFDALQGARATYTVADFDRDRRPDLVVTDTFGIVRYFRQADKNDASGAPRFEPALELGRLPIRGVPDAADWDGDGWIDVVAGSDPEHVVVFLNRRGADAKAPFAPASPIKLPGAPYGAGAPLAVTDYNRDGDADILLHTAYGYTCFYERSFIESGYAQANFVALEKRPE